MRIALVEPWEADVRWFCMALSELCGPATVTCYSTEISALEPWWQHTSAIFDVVVVADRLPMLSLHEFVDSARTILPDVPIVVAGPPAAGGPSLEADVRTSPNRFLAPTYTFCMRLWQSGKTIGSNLRTLSGFLMSVGRLFLSNCHPSRRLRAHAATATLADCSGNLTPVMTNLSLPRSLAGSAKLLFIPVREISRSVPTLNYFPARLISR